MLIDFVVYYLASAAIGVAVWQVYQWRTRRARRARQLREDMEMCKRDAARRSAYHTPPHMARPLQPQRRTAIVVPPRRPASPIRDRVPTDPDPFPMHAAAGAVFLDAVAPTPAPAPAFEGFHGGASGGAGGGSSWESDSGSSPCDSGSSAVDSGSCDSGGGAD